VENVNRPAEVNQVQEGLERRPWQTPVVEELLVNETENVVSGSGGDLGVYSS
jgi:hypothetical protein